MGWARTRLLAKKGTIDAEEIRAVAEAVDESGPTA